MKVKNVKILALSVLSATALMGCEAINMGRAAGLMMDYNLLATGASIFNSQDGRQYLIPPAHDSNPGRMLVCYNTEGLFSDTAEEPLRNAADEWLALNKPEMHIVSSENRSGVWESRTCYEFKYEKSMPIGAYLDEKSGDVVVVGEQAVNKE